ncbi:putative helicase mov-10-B.1 [Notolabrus celidotus]|uniref:putative helicase mov-10-B.1 n=1 Tax=Notolabrus celidotus TaxID=1203425 RepID=UPI00149053F2|nr:putative helicase mov-10-B.1 [Notolabrus celidotus]
MSSPEQQEQPWITVGPRRVKAKKTKPSGSPRGAHNASDVEEQMAHRAQLNVLARRKMARLFQQYRRAKRTSNRHDVIVTSEPASEEEMISLTSHEKKKVVPITVKNNGAIAVDFRLQASDLVKNIFTIKDGHGNNFNSVQKHTLGPGESFQIRVHFSSSHAGFYEQLLVFKFETQQPSSEMFEIMRLLEITYLTSVTEEPQPTTDREPVCEQQTEDPGDERISCTILLKIVRSLKKYGMPQNIGDLTIAERTLETGLNWGNYFSRFQVLLHLEELQEQSVVNKYTQKSATLFEHRDLFGLQIPDLSKSSSMELSGCNVLVTLFRQPGVFFTICYKGWVQYVKEEQVFLFLMERPANLEDFKYRVQFIINRIPLRVQHRAASLVTTFKLRELLFPTGKFSAHHTLLHRLVQNEGSNPEQCSAVQHILATSAKPAPYLVFGPPGTGKTVTLVEAIKQIVMTKASCKILVCAPSNSATDHLCEKICEKIFEGEEGECKIYRLYALSYKADKTSTRKFYSNLNKDNVPCIIPSKKYLMTYKIMVTTLQTAARLVTGAIPPGFYSYIFVDEAGQATETECLIPLAGLFDKKKCQVVLAGDPKQLGPIITSRIADEYGLGVSLLERLMRDIELYKAHSTTGFNSRFVTKLLRNYRSHAAILKVPNELFYKGELQPYAAKDECSSYCEWELLPKKGFPLIFHGVAGTDERDANCTSVYNMAEVEVLKEYLKALLAHLRKKGVDKVGENEIGIIAPYRQQVEKIQEALKTDQELKKQKLDNILVGTVEAFQGKESQVILVSTVRSNLKMTEEDQRFTLGFVKNEKRFNVAMTRARALLIVIGDPRALRTVTIWNKFIHYCHKEGGYRGITLSDAEEKVTPSDQDSPSTSEE